MNVFQFFITCKRTNNANNATHYVKLGKKRRESSKRNCYIISPRVIINAMSQTPVWRAYLHMHWCSGHLFQWVQTTPTARNAHTPVQDLRRKYTCVMVPSLLCHENYFDPSWNLCCAQETIKFHTSSWWSRLRCRKGIIWPSTMVRAPTS